MAIVSEVTTSTSISSEPLDNLLNHVRLREVVDQIHDWIAPVWPLRDYVAVNPFLGMADQNFLECRARLRKVRQGDLLMPLKFYRESWMRGEWTADDLQEALEQARREYPTLFESSTLDQMVGLLSTAIRGKLENEKEKRYKTFTEAFDETDHLGWTANVTEELSRYCSSHYDEGQAVWQSPWKSLPIYEAWREAIAFDQRFERLGVLHFRKFVSKIPRSSIDAIAFILDEVQVPQKHWFGFLIAQLYSVAGWASYAKYRSQATQRPGPWEDSLNDDDLLGLLAIRLSYEYGLICSGVISSGVLSWNDLHLPPDDSSIEKVLRSTGEQAMAQYVFQLAGEIAYRKRLCGKLRSNPIPRASLPAVPRFQFVFCIDVRSEVIRRHLEATSSEIETFGFAGFFGIPMTFVPFGEKQGTSQCPVLIRPQISVHERLEGTCEQDTSRAFARDAKNRKCRDAWDAFQVSAISSFSFVESMGLSYVGKLMKNSLEWWDNLDFRTKRSSSNAKHGGSKRRVAFEEGMTLSQRVDMAHGILKNMGLTHRFAAIVVLCGHASQTNNNPYRAGLDCGACGGHSGESNARMAATLLNDPEVRRSLHERGIAIPDTTRFIAAVHNTTTDDIQFLDLEDISDSSTTEGLRGDLEELRCYVLEAGKRTRAERVARLSGASEERISLRSRDWSEVRPEWGLAGNAALIVAPRSRTKGLDLQGRTFLHHYDASKDPDGKVLELIMTAPMVVANWINLQYFATSIDNRAFGSGNKVLHNVVGQFGILQGNGGDLMTGLPWQSVHDGNRLQHVPLRLQVFLDAPRGAIEKVLQHHPAVEQLASNGWLYLISMEGNDFLLYSNGGKWVECEATLTGA